MPNTPHVFRRLITHWGTAAFLGGLAGAAAARILDEWTVWRFKNLLGGEGDEGEFEVEVTLEDDLDPNDVIAHFVVDNPDSIMGDLAQGTCLVKSIKGVRLPDGDTHMVAVVDRDGTPFYGVIWGLPPEGEDVDFAESVEAWRREVELYPHGEENIEKVDNVGGIFFYAGEDHPYGDVLIEAHQAEAGDDAETSIREIVRDFVSTSIFEKRRQNVEERFATDVEALMLQIEAGGSYLAAGPRRRHRLLLEQL